MRRICTVVVALVLLALAAPAAGAPSGKKCEKSFGSPEVTQCVDIRGSDAYGILTNEGSKELCGDLTQKATANRRAGGADYYESTRSDRGCLQPGASWETSFGIVVDQREYNPNCNPYQGGSCEDVDRYSSICVETFRDGQSISRYVCSR